MGNVTDEGRVDVRGKHQTNLGELLDARGIKRTWLARQIKVAPATMIRIANGDTLPGLRRAQEIANILGVTVETLWPSQTGEETNEEK